jgi:carbonic anhydrase
MRRSVSLFFAFVVAITMAVPAAAQFPAPLQPPYNVASLWPQLMAGNDLFIRGALPYTQLDDVRKATQTEQNPPVAVLSCSDSRVPPEIVFGRGLGERFVVRAAVIIVLAHERCGAVTEALKKTDPGTPSLLALVTRIRKSFSGIDLGKKRDAVRPAIIANAKASADYLVSHSKVIRDAVHKHEVEIVVAYYGFGDGKVERIR